MHNDMEIMASRHAVAGEDRDNSVGISVHNGFPNPAAAAAGRRASLALDLNSWLIKHPISTYLFRISGDSWTEQGLFDGDIAIVDRAAVATDQGLVLVWEDDHFELLAHWRPATAARPWGVVTATIHRFDRLGSGQEDRP